jgi:hypothetical protein
MKVKVTVEYEVEPEHELNQKEHSNMVGMLVRMTRNRIVGFQGRRLGGEHAKTGWEVHVSDVEVSASGK